MCVGDIEKKPEARGRTVEVLLKRVRQRWYRIEPSAGENARDPSAALAVSTLNAALLGSPLFVWTLTSPRLE